MAKSKVKLISGKCVICDNYGIGHHYIRRNDLTNKEKSDPKYQIVLCIDHHKEVHDSTTSSDLRFYDKYCLTDLLTIKCGFDPRWEKWVSGQRWKIKNGV